MLSSQSAVPALAPEYDVAILGSGIAGTTLGAILARHGLRVLLLDSATHPRFAIGESTIPNTSLMLELLAHRYDVPEILHIANPRNVLKHVGSSCGVKRNFGFVFQREGQAPDPMEWMQLGVSELARSPESHWFRQDIDAYMLLVAIHYGVTSHTKVRITDVDIDANGVQLKSSTGDCFTSKYLVDAGGYQSPLAIKFGLREVPTRMKHHSRCLFTHMVDVLPYDDFIPSTRLNPMSTRFFEGTLHHVFERGWIWVIPFNNQPASTNPLCSVGLTLDPRLYARPNVSPEDEFRQFIKRFPTVEAQFRSARTVRDWVSTDRLQYSSRQAVGYRFCLVAHAVGNLDALFSRGLINTMEVINALADRVITAIKTNDFSVERFEYLERLQQNLLDYNDRLVNCAFISFADFELWNAWFRIWSLGTVLTEAKLVRAMKKYQLLRDRDALSIFCEPPQYPGLIFAHHPGFKDLFDDAVHAVECFEQGQITARDAARRIFRRIQTADFVREVLLPIERPFIWAIQDPKCLNLHARPKEFLGWLLKGAQREPILT